jgi:hypothetical protein
MKLKTLSAAIMHVILDYIQKYSFPGVKRGRDVTLTTHPHLVPRSRMGKSYILYPPKSFRGV